MNDQEAEAGFRSIAVSIRRFDGVVIASRNIGVRVEQAGRVRMTDRYLDRLRADAVKLLGHLV